MSRATEWAVDGIAVGGGVSLVAGVGLQFGLPAALMMAGVLMIALALRAAKVHEDSHAIDSE